MVGDLVTMPIDVTKTRLQLSGEGGKQMYKNAFDCAGVRDGLRYPLILTCVLSEDCQGRGRRGSLEGILPLIYAVCR